MTIFRGKPELLREFREGGRSALQAVYWEYIDLVAAVVRRGTSSLCGSRRIDFDEERDLVQETFARAFHERARLSYDGLGDYRAYLLAVCRNTVVDAFRKRGREVPVDWEQWAARAATPITDGSPESEVEWADPATMAVVRAYVASLNPGLRQLYELRYVQGKPQVWVAEKMRTSRQRVRTMEKRLRRGLEKALARAGRGVLA